MKWGPLQTQWVVWALLAFVVMACSSSGAISAVELQGQTAKTATALPPLPTLDAAQVQAGRVIYQRHCAACHGAKAEGVPHWATPGPDGLYPAPPHDNTGHTWHHSDRVLYETIYSGMGDPLRPDAPLRMLAWGQQLSDAEIRAVIEYFKSLWTEENRDWQWEQTLNDFAPTPTPSLDHGAQLSLKETEMDEMVAQCNQMMSNMSGMMGSGMMNGGMMGGTMNGSGVWWASPWFWLGWVMTFALLALVGLALVWVIRRTRSAPAESPLDILKRRYAQGDIPAEQFEIMKRQLSGG